jgi:hypothetical protein
MLGGEDITQDDLIVSKLLGQDITKGISNSLSTSLYVDLKTLIGEELLLSTKI